MPIREDLTGKVYSRLTVIEYVGHPGPNGALWLVRCSCGNTKVVLAGNLKRGGTVSCGCLRAEKIGGLNKTHRAMAAGSPAELRRAFYRWGSMKARCYNPQNSRYSQYGGRGIKVCAAWRESFENFLADMGLPPPGASLDRKNNDKGYSPTNCRWASKFQQAGNKTNTLLVKTPRGTMCVAEAAREFSSVRLGTVYSRIALGWSPEDAVFKPRVPHRERR